MKKFSVMLYTPIEFVVNAKDSDEAIAKAKRQFANYGLMNYKLHSKYHLTNIEDDIHLFAIDGED